MLLSALVLLGSHGMGLPLLQSKDYESPLGPSQSFEKLALVLLSFASTGSNVAPSPKLHLTSRSAGNSRNIGASSTLEDPTIDRPDLDMFSAVALKDELKSRDLPVHGKTAERVTRLVNLESHTDVPMSTLDDLFPSNDEAFDVRAFRSSLADFSCAHDVYAFASGILRHQLAGSKVGEETKNILLSLLSYHPNCAEKIGSGVIDIVVDVSPYKNSRCFWVVRTDGSMTDFSIRKAAKALAVDWGEDNANIPDPNVNRRSVPKQ